MFGFVVSNLFLSDFINGSDRSRLTIPTNNYKNRSHSIQAQVKKQILEQFYQLLKAKTIQPRFQVSVNGNNFITKDNLQLQDIHAAEVIFFYEIINSI